MKGNTIAEAIAVCGADLMGEGRFDAGDVVLAVRLRYPELVEQESHRLVDKAILAATKRWLRGATATDEDETLPGLAIPRAISVPKPNKPGDYYYAPAAHATWTELVLHGQILQQNVDHAEAALDAYEAELERVQPLMESDAGLTYGEAVERIGRSAAA